jgi:hypothetical protein
MVAGGEALHPSPACATMDSLSHIPAPQHHDGARRRRRLILSVVAIVALAGLAGGVAAARRHGVSRTPAKPLYVRTDRAVKLDLLTRLPKPPQLLIFGGSRATRFEPSRFQRLTGLRGFNLAFQNGRPEDAWAFVNFIHTRYPHLRLHVVWFIHVEAFREQGLSLGLVQDRRLSRWLPPALVAAQRAKLPTTAAEMPKGRDLALTRYGPDGAVLYNRYDLDVAHGRPLSRSLDNSIATVLKRYATTTVALFPRSELYFQKTLGLLNKMGSTPAVVFMPLHPRLLAAVRAVGWDKRHREVIAYLEGLQKDYRFCLLDLSKLSSFGGDPKAFYDGYHVKQANARKLVDTVVARCPEAFK